MIGVASQAGRPISLAKEWEPIARHLLKEHEQELLMLQSSDSKNQIEGKGDYAFNNQKKHVYDKESLGGGRVLLQEEKEILAGDAGSGGKMLAP